MANEHLPPPRIKPPMVRSSRAYIIPASTLMGTRAICSYFATGAPRSRGATVTAATRPLIPARADIPGGEYNITAVRLAKS